MERTPNWQHNVTARLRSYYSQIAWEQIILAEFSEFLGECYAGLEQVSSDQPDRLEGMQETVDSDLIISIEQDNQVVAMTAIKMLKFTSLAPNVVIVKEIAVLPKYQGQGFSKLLRAHMLELTKPDIIFGVANNPASALSRAATLHEFGYQTYWANVPLTGGNESDIEFIGQYLTALAYESYLGSYHDGVMNYTDFEIWAEQLGASIPQSAQAALSKILDFQTESGHPAMATLISIKTPTEQVAAEE